MVVEAHAVLVDLGLDGMAAQAWAPSRKSSAIAEAVLSGDPFMPDSIDHEARALRLRSPS